MTTRTVSLCSATKLSICSTSPSGSEHEDVAKNTLFGTSSVISFSLCWILLKLSSRQRYKVVPFVVLKFHTSSPLAMRTHQSSTNHDLPIFGAPQSIDTPCGSNESMQKLIGLIRISINVSPSTTTSFLLLRTITTPSKKY